jgi:hypothetical protein
MSTDAPQETLYIPSYPAIVVAWTLLVFSLLFAVIWLYQYKWAPSEFENIWLASQRQAPQPGLAPPNDDTVISLQRTQCFGSCPAYQVSISGSGDRTATVLGGPHGLIPHFFTSMRNRFQYSPESARATPHQSASWPAMPAIAASPPFHARPARG